MRQTVNFGQEYSFGDTEFRNTRLLDTALYDILEILESPEEEIFITTSPGRPLLHIGWGVFLVRYDDVNGFETAKIDFPLETKILEDGSILPRYFGEFEKDGIKYIIIDCDERLAPKDDPTMWVPGTYRNMIYDLRSTAEQISYEVKHEVKSIL